MSFDFKTINDDLRIQQREYRLQLAVVEQIPVWFPILRFFHIPNRGGSAADGFFKKKMGAKKGASDLVVSWRDLVPAGPKGTISFDTLQCGLLELKAPGGALDGAQNKFLSSWAAIGWNTAVCRSCHEVFDTLCKWGLKPASFAIFEPDYRSDNDKKQAAYNYFAPAPP